LLAGKGRRQEVKMTDSSWGIAITIVVTLGVGLLLLFLEHRTRWFASRLGQKSLSYSIVSRSELLDTKSVPSGIGGEFKISFDGRPVSQLTALVVRLHNDGPAEIRPEDFYEPLRIELDGDVLRAEVSDSYPAHLPVVFSPAALEFEPFLFNKDESITINLLVTGFESTESVKVVGRIAGVKGPQLKPEPSARRSSLIFTIFGVAIVIPTIFIFIMWFALLKFEASGVATLVEVLIMFFVMLSLVFASMQLIESFNNKQ
jgi:hypothetical protein